MAYVVEHAQYLRENPHEFAAERHAEQEAWVAVRNAADPRDFGYNMDEVVYFREHPEEKERLRIEKQQQAAAYEAAKQQQLVDQAAVEVAYYDEGPRKIMAKMVNPRLAPLHVRADDEEPSEEELAYPVGCKVARKRIEASGKFGGVGTVVGHTKYGQIRVQFVTKFEGPQEWDLEP